MAADRPPLWRVVLVVGYGAVLLTALSVSLLRSLWRGLR